MLRQYLEYGLKIKAFINIAFIDTIEAEHPREFLTNLTEHAIANFDRAVSEGLSPKAILNSSLDSDNNKAIHLAAQKGLFGVVELLLSKGASFNVKNKAGETVMSILERSAENPEAAKIIEIIKQLKNPFPTILAVQKGKLSTEAKKELPPELSGEILSFLFREKKQSSDLIDKKELYQTKNLLTLFNFNISLLIFC